MMLKTIAKCTGLVACDNQDSKTPEVHQALVQRIIDTTQFTDNRTLKTERP